MIQKRQDVLTVKETPDSTQDLSLALDLGWKPVPSQGDCTSSFYFDSDKIEIPGSPTSVSKIVSLPQISKNTMLIVSLIVIVAQPSRNGNIRRVEILNQI